MQYPMTCIIIWFFPPNESGDFETEYIELFSKLFMGSDNEF